MGVKVYQNGAWKDVGGEMIHQYAHKHISISDMNKISKIFSPNAECTFKEIYFSIYDNAYQIAGGIYINTTKQLSGNARYHIGGFRFSNIISSSYNASGTIWESDGDGGKAGTHFLIPVFSGNQYSKGDIFLSHPSKSNRYGDEDICIYFQLFFDSALSNYELDGLI